MTATKDLCRVCEKTPAYRTSYFEHNEEDDAVCEIIIILCEECFVESNQWCEDHGPCSMTNNPAFLDEDLDLSELEEGALPTVSYCCKCLKEDIKSLGAEKRREYKTLVERHYDEETRVMIRALEDVYLPKKLVKKYPTVAACCFLSGMSGTDVEIVVLNLIEKASRTESNLITSHVPISGTYEILPR